MKRCFVFAAGSYYGLRERPGDPGDFVIAADAGYRVCLEECIRPDLLVGDFDSMEPPADFARVRRLPGPTLELEGLEGVLVPAYRPGA